MTLNSSKPSPSLLHHLSLCLDGNHSILFIHGALGSSQDWDMVTPHMSTAYHILIPDLPGHRTNRHVQPFSLLTSASSIRDLIAAEAKGGRAHIVGLSLGARVALALATTYPEVVMSMVISGLSTLSIPKAVKPMTSWLYYLETRLENLIPRAIIRWVLDGTDLLHSDLQTLTPALCQEIIDTISAEVEMKPWPSRTLIVAATKKGGLAPSLDSPELAKRLAHCARALNPETVAVEQKAMRHLWCRQDPGLFAELVQRWIEKGVIIEGFERL